MNENVTSDLISAEVNALELSIKNIVSTDHVEYLTKTVLNCEASRDTGCKQVINSLRPRDAYMRQ